MIATPEGASDPVDALTPSTRCRRGQWMTLGAFSLATLCFLASLPPLGAFYPLLFFSGLALLFFCVPWLFGAVHTWNAHRRALHDAFFPALLWWLAPIPLGLLTWLVAAGPLPHRLAFELAAPALERLLADARQLPARRIELRARWLGPWPANRIRRYPSGELRLNLRYATSPSATHGLFWSPSGTLPGRWQPDATLDLPGDWHAWSRRTLR